VLSLNCDNKTEGVILKHEACVCVKKISSKDKEWGQLSIITFDIVHYSDDYGQNTTSVLSLFGIYTVSGVRSK
jgi:hypothetical protein